VVDAVAALELSHLPAPLRTAVAEHQSVDEAALSEADRELRGRLADAIAGISPRSPAKSARIAPGSGARAECPARSSSGNATGCPSAARYGTRGPPRCRRHYLSYFR